MESKSVTLVLRELYEGRIAVFKIPASEVDDESFEQINSFLQDYSLSISFVDEYECGSMEDLYKKVGDFL